MDVANRDIFRALMLFDPDEIHKCMDPAQGKTQGDGSFGGKHKGTVLLCCFSPQLGVKFTSGVRKCQGQRGKKAATGFIT